MDRVFLDANVLFSAAYKADARVSRLWALRDIVLCSSGYALEEARSNLVDANQRARLTRLADAIQFFDTPQRRRLRGIALPEKDVPILLAAIEARCTHLLTGDVRHFGPYFGKKLEGVTIVLPGDYLRNRQA